MKSSLSHTITALFSVMVLLALSSAILVTSSLQQNSGLSQTQTTLAHLRFEAKNLQLLHCQSSTTNLSQPTDTAPATAALLTLKQLTRTIDALAEEHSPQGTSTRTNLADTLELFRTNYLTLLSSYNQNTKNHQINQELFALIYQRLPLLPPRLIENILPELEALQVQVASLSQEDPSPQQLLIKKIYRNLVEQIHDPVIIKNLDTILNNFLQSVTDIPSLRNQEQALVRITAVFTSQTDAVIADISSAIAKKKAWRHILTSILITSLIATIVVTFALIRSRLNLFQNNLVLAKESIHSGRFDYQPDPNLAEELAMSLKFIAETGDRLAQCQTIQAEYRERWQTLFDAMTEWVITCDTNGICTTSNPRIKEVTGYDAFKCINQPLAAVLEGYDGATLNANLAQALATPTAFPPLNHDIQHLNGSLIPVTIKGQPIINTTGQYQGHTLFIHDMSAQHHTESQLTQATRATNFLNRVLELALLNIDLPELMDRFLGLVVELSWVGLQPKAAFFLIDKKSNCLTMAAQHGIDRHIKTSCALLPMGTCLCGRAALSGKVIFADCHDPRHEMSYIGMAVHGHYCIPVHTVAGEIIGVVNLYLNPDHPRDSTIESILTNATTMIGSIIRRRQAEDELMAVNQDLERRIEARTAQLTATNQELDSFAYSVSHDLRAPLRAIDGFSQALHEDYGANLPPQARDYLSRIRAGCARMESLTNDLLNLSRLTRIELTRDKVDLSQVAREISEEIRAESPHRMVEWQFPPALEIVADPTMIRAALYNLLANAWKYSQYTTTAIIELGSFTSDSGETVYFIRDNGAGFDMRYADTLFKAFQRLHPANKFSGNGIGLATVKRIIHCHGGKIWAESKIGKGATFYFTVSHGNY